MKNCIAKECAKYMQNICFDNDEDKYGAVWITYVLYFCQLKTLERNGPMHLLQRSWDSAKDPDRGLQ